MSKSIRGIIQLVYRTCVKSFTLTTENCMLCLIHFYYNHNFSIKITSCPGYITNISRNKLLNQMKQSEMTLYWVLFKIWQLRPLVFAILKSLKLIVVTGQTLYSVDYIRISKITMIAIMWRFTITINMTNWTYVLKIYKL